MASRRAYSSPAVRVIREAPQAAWAAARRMPGEKAAGPPQAPQPSKKKQLLLQQQQQAVQGQPLIKQPQPQQQAPLNPNRKPPVVLPRINKTTGAWSSYAAASALRPSSPSAAAGAAMAATAATAGDPTARPSLRALSLLAVQRGVPFIGFGMVDNAIMIVSGDYIEMSIGVTLGIGTMTAAALGNILADVVGLNLGGLIEEASLRMGVPEPALSPQQRAMGVTRAVTYAGSSLGIAFGCLLGMLPLLFVGSDAREEQPAEVFQSLGERATDLLRCQRAVIYHLDPATGAVLHQYSTEPGRPGLPLVLGQDLVDQVRQTKGGVRYHATATMMPAAASVIVDGGAAEAMGSSTPSCEQESSRSDDPNAVESALCLPVLDPEGRVLAVVAAVNRRPDDHHRHHQPEAAAADSLHSHHHGRLRRPLAATTPTTTAFGPEDAQTLAGLCTQVAEALVNMARRPEEHVSLGENLELLAAHSRLPVRAYQPSLRALIFGPDGEGQREGGTRLRTETVPIRIDGRGVIGAAAAAVVAATPAPAAN